MDKVNWCVSFYGRHPLTGIYEHISAEEALIDPVGRSSYVKQDRLGQVSSNTTCYFINIKKWTGKNLGEMSYESLEFTVFNQYMEAEPHSRQSTEVPSLSSLGTSLHDTTIVTYYE
jgi:hypothetical protein